MILPLFTKGWISTAKPNAEELPAAPHRLLDIRDPSQAYSAADFRRDALAEMADITAAGRIPLLVGGTMLYFKALLEGLSPLPSADPEVRARIEQQAAEQGWESLHRQLQEVDPVAAARIHPNDPQRLSRALEVFISGKTLTELTQTSGDALPYQVHQFAIAPASRELLHQRIEQRFHQMLASGFEAEVRALFARGDLHTDLPSIRCVGYRQMWSYLEGEISYDEMVYRGVCATRQLAKRQITRCVVGKGFTGLTVKNQNRRVTKYYRLLVLSQAECVQLRRIVRNFFRIERFKVQISI